MERPEYLSRERHEHPVFQDTTQNHAHAMARELWRYSQALELKVDQLHRQVGLLVEAVHGK